VIDLSLSADEISLSFVACVSNSEVLRANLLASPCLGPDPLHEIIFVKNCPSAVEGLNIGLERAQHGWIVCMHQNVDLPQGWNQCLPQQLREDGL